MHGLNALSESSLAIRPATTSLAFFNPKKAVVYRSGFVPMNIGMQSLKNSSVRAPPAHCRACMEVSTR